MSSMCDGSCRWGWVPTGGLLCTRCALGNGRWMMWVLCLLCVCAMQRLVGMGEPLLPSRLRVPLAQWRLSLYLAMPMVRIQWRTVTFIIPTPC